MSIWRWTSLLLACVVFGALLAGACGCGAPQGTNLGAVPPNVTLDSLEGSEPVSLEALRGNVVLLDFWATWCGPCRETMPILEGFHREFGKEGLVVIGISQESKSTVEKFEKTSSTTYRQAIDTDGEANRIFGVNAIPRAFLLDREGRVVWTGHPGDEDELRKAILNVITKS